MVLGPGVRLRACTERSRSVFWWLIANGQNPVNDRLTHLFRRSLARSRTTVQDRLIIRVGVAQSSQPLLHPGQGTLSEAG
jgi:hypothetical protein